MNGQKYSLKDISIVIPTYNRHIDLKETIKSFLNKIKDLKEVIIVDQSTDEETSLLVKSIKNKKLKYLKSNIPSLTAARNLGVKNAKGAIIGFLDDDVSLDKDYFQEILNVFNNNSEVKGVGGWFIEKKRISRFDSIIKNVFFIEHNEKNRARVLSSYGATYPYELKKETFSQWIPGFNMFFKRDIFSNMRFDENMKRYALAEDFDFTYRVNKRYPKSLVITPKAKLIHRASVVERMPTEKVSYMNQIHHFYLNYKNFDSNFKEKFVFLWTVLGISILRVLQFARTRKKADFLKLKFYFKSLFYCISNLNKIKKGNLDWQDN